MSSCEKTSGETQEVRDREMDTVPSDCTRNDASQLVNHAWKACPLPWQENSWDQLVVFHFQRS